VSGTGGQMRRDCMHFFLKHWGGEGSGWKV